MPVPGLSDQTLSPGCYIFSIASIPGSGGALTSVYTLLSAADQAVLDALSPRLVLELHIYSPTVALNWRHDSTGTALWPLSAGGEEIVSAINAHKSVFLRSNVAGAITDAVIKVYA